MYSNIKKHKSKEIKIKKVRWHNKQSHFQMHSLGIEFGTLRTQQKKKKRIPHSRETRYIQHFIFLFKIILCVY